ncbi:YpsA SLOG family protein [Chroococcus sp. FPU101]|uniref:YpsA SLOG family protein n=1 Tax=Chroococcus sp. FPU101 TaxID=1974212 RepID=UPI001A8EB7CA|nr:putative molybdenum carrier protein [Chroococcus sp. FPU101]GFE69103.1 hypothetical protein CFPU101_17130 [Chroococcus sp. FPU101]
MFDLSLNFIPVEQPEVIFSPEGEIHIPVIDFAHDPQKFLSQKEILRNTQLYHLLTDDELGITEKQRQTLAILRLDNQQEPEIVSRKLKNYSHFPDEIERDILYVSGTSILYADPELCQKYQNNFFKKEDSKLFYGGLSNSNNHQAISKIEETLVVKFIDCESTDLNHEFETADGHGKISPRLVEKFNATADRPFQFRLSYTDAWKKDHPNTPEISFQAKGTFLPNAELTDQLGYDLIIDVSQIKGLNKEEIQRLLQLDTVELPKTLLGNMNNAKVEQWNCSWQTLLELTPEAIQKDIVPITQKVAQQLAEVQKDPITLKAYIINQAEKDKELNSKFPVAEEKSNQNDKTIEILKADRYHLLNENPYIRETLENNTINKWKNLAQKGAIHPDGRMAMPAWNLRPGTIVCGDVPNGTTLLVGRYPTNPGNLVSYQVDNRQKGAEHLTKYKGCFFIDPNTWRQNHQGDFDGDNGYTLSQEKVPNCVACRPKATEPLTFTSPPKLEKRTQKELGRTTLEAIPHIAQNIVGLYANAVGKIYNGEIQSGEPVGKFQSQQKELIERGTTLMQAATDLAKGAPHPEEIDPDFLNDAKEFTYKHPTHFFNALKNEKVYRSCLFPTDNTRLSILPEIVNQEWSQVQLPSSRPLHEFRYIFTPPFEKNTPEFKNWETHYLTTAQEIKERFEAHNKTIHQKKLHENDIKESYSEFYKYERNRIEEYYKTPEERQLFMLALGYLETASNKHQEVQNRCDEIAIHLKPEFNHYSNYERNTSAIPLPTYVYSVPFKQKESLTIEAEEAYQNLEFESLKNKIFTFELSNHNGKIQVFNNNELIGTIQEPLKIPENEKITIMASLKPEQQGLLSLTRNTVIDALSVAKETLDYLDLKYETKLDNKLPMVHFALLNSEKNPEFIEKLKEKYANNYLENQLKFSDQDLRYEDHKGQSKSLYIIAPENCGWINNSSLKKGGLVYNLCSEELAKYLENFEVKTLTLVGQQYNAFKGIDFKQYQGKIFELKVEADQTENPQYKHQPIITIGNQTLARFATNTPKLPIGTTFIGEIIPKGKSLIVEIQENSIKIPEPKAIAYSNPLKVKKPKKIEIISSNSKITQPSTPKVKIELDQEKTTQNNNNCSLTVISGGQTGVDRLGLEIAKSLNIPTKGYAAGNYMTEKGIDLSLKEFNLIPGKEYSSLKDTYNFRTGANIKISDGTLILGDHSSPGSKVTIQYAKALNKPYLTLSNEQLQNPELSAQIITEWIKNNNIKTLNIAGNRESKLNQQALENIKQTLSQALSHTLEPQQKTEVENKPYNWSRYPVTNQNCYEVSSNGDRRFSSLSATLKDGRTIEEAYQLDVKGYREISNDWKAGKGKQPLKKKSQSELAKEYKELWKQYLKENSELLQDLIKLPKGTILTDQFATTEINQAKTLSDILNSIHQHLEQKSIEKVTKQKPRIQMVERNDTKIIIQDPEKFKVELISDNNQSSKLPTEIASVSEEINSKLNQQKDRSSENYKLRTQKVNQQSKSLNSQQTLEFE